MNDRPLNIPVILGTTRKGRMSAHAARFMAAEIAKREGIVGELIDIGDIPMPIDDAGEGIKDPAFSEKMIRADALVIITPEYNHSFPGLLKHVLIAASQNTSIRRPASSAFRPVRSGAYGRSRIFSPSSANWGW
jgi:NAD(P)H-dependent FMN reductase